MSWHERDTESDDYSSSPSGKGGSKCHSKTTSSRKPDRKSSCSNGKHATIIVPKIPFFEKEHIDGISRIEDLDLITQLQDRLDRLNRPPPGFNGFAVNLLSQLSIGDIPKLKKKPYLVSPRPEGVRYLLYIDSTGEMIMENRAQYIFKVAKDGAPRLIPKDTVLDGVVTRKTVRDGAIQKGKLTFVIMDSTRVKGINLTDKGIQERISTVQKEIMEPRLEAIKRKRICLEREVFDLDITNYEDISRMKDEHLSAEFKDCYEYPLRSFIFHLSDGEYLCGKRGQIFEWKENSIQNFSFRLGISGKRPSEGDLYVAGKGANRREEKCDTIIMTDELRDMDGSIIECRFVDQNWVFLRQRPDRSHPNTKSSIEGKFKAMENSVSRETLIQGLF